MDVEQTILRFADVLRATERQPPDAMRDYQRGLLDKLLAHAARNVPFYRKRGLEPDAGRFDSIPVLTRRDVQKNFGALKSTAVPPYAGQVEESMTSGSTGAPLRFLHEKLHDAASGSQSERVYDWWGIDGRKTLATFMSTYNPLSKAPTVRTDGWRPGVPGGVRHVLELMHDIDAQLDWLTTTGADYLFGRGGAHFVALARRAEERAMTMHFARALSTGGPVHERARTMTRRVFRAEICDLYGASETGLIAGQCPDCGFYHTCDETAVVEVLRDDGAPCTEGEIGRVVVTPLYLYSMPLLRYAPGDYAMRGPALAACGRGLGSLKDIQGRTRSVFVLADGRLIHPYANASKLSELFGYQQIQILQTAVDELEIHYVPAAGPEPDLAAVQDFVATYFDESLKMRLVKTDRLPAAANGKFEETRSLVAERLESDVPSA